MKGDALVNMLKDRRILVIIIAVVVIIAAVAAYVVLKDDGGNGGSSSTDDLVIGDGQTREITEDMTIDGNITVESGGILTIASGVTVTMTASDAKINVDGTLDSEGTIQFVRVGEDGTQDVVYSNATGESRSIISNGNMTITLENYHSETEWGDTTIESGINGFISGAVYSADGKTVTITTLAAAAAAKEPLGDIIYLMGTFTNTGAASIPTGIDVVVSSGANVTLGTVTLANGALFDATVGTVNATISNATGTATMTAGSGVTFNGVASGGSSLLVVDGDLNGALTISSGRVNVDVLKVDNTGSSLEVGSSATLILQDIDTVADGRISTITDSNTEAVVKVSGAMVIGNKPTTLTDSPTATTAGISGKFSTNGSGYIKAYPGVSGITTDGTTFCINGIEYMTIYGSANVSTVLSAEQFSLTGITATDMSDVTKWNTKESMLGTALTSTSVTGSSTAGYYYSNQIMTITITNNAKVDFIIDGITIKADQSSISVAAGSYSFSAAGAGTVTINNVTISNEIVVPNTGALTLTIGVASSGDTGGSGDNAGEQSKTTKISL